MFFGYAFGVIQKSTPEQPETPIAKSFNPEEPMNKIIQVDDSDGFESLLGQRITLFCLNYIYTGMLVGVNDTFLLLEDAAIVYETGELNTKDWKDAQPLPKPWRVQIGAVESWGLLK
jgi:hypothetical protein